MKTITFFLLLSITILSCKKNDDAPVPAPPPAKSYLVKYSFNSNNATASNFTIVYVVGGNATTIHNASSGWNYSFSGTSGQYVSVSAQSATMNASVYVEIKYDNSILKTGFSDGVNSSSGYAYADGTLPN